MTSTLLPSFPAVDDVLFNFAQSDGLSQANRVNSARNQRLTATVVFLDAGVTDYQTLQAGVIPGIATVILSPNQDGIEQITAFLQQNPQITTIHLVSHGAPGCLYLGNCQLNLTNIYDYRQQLQNWAKINRILLYGCQVAAGDAGTEFINKLSQITGAKIAASSGRVGNAALGGSWELEVIVSSAESEQDLNISLAFGGETLATYQGVFALTLVGVWDSDRLSYAYAVTVVGNYGYAVGDTLEIIDISNPSNPIFKGSYDIYEGQDVQIVGNYAYVADDDSGLQIIDISNPTNPTLKGNYDTSGTAIDVQIVGNYAYVADGWSGGLQIIDISNPTNPTFKGNYYTSGNAWGVQVIGNYAYIADWGSGLQIIDISNPTNPILKGNYDTYRARDVEVVGNYAYVADDWFGLQIIDISNPTNPTLKGNYNTSGLALDVQIVANYAYVADYWSGLQIIDISNPINPTLKGNYDTSGAAFDVQIVGNYAYVADGYSGLQIIDISNPTNPTLKGKYNIFGSAQDVQVVGNYAYVADYNSGLQIIDISSPINPLLVGKCNTSGDAYGVQVVGDYAYLADAGAGLQIIDISNPTTPILVGKCNTSGDAYGVQIVGNYAYVAASDGGLNIIDVSEFTNPQTVTVTLAVSPSSVSEDGTANMAYTFTRSGVTTNALTVNYTVGGTATFSTDYTQSGAATFTSKTGTVTFAANSTTAKVTIDPTADTTVENNETVALTLAAGTGYKVGTTTPVTGTINDDELPIINLAVSTANVYEDSTQNLLYTFTRMGSTKNALTINYNLAGTATLNTDYTRTGTNNTVTFAAGSSTATVTVDPTADTTIEPNETVILTLAAGTGYKVGTTTPVTGTIVNDDTPSSPGTLSFGSPTFSINENGTPVTAVTVTRTGGSNGAVSATVKLTNGTATAPSDYNNNSITVNFANGEISKTVTVPIVNDTLPEPDETVQLILINPTSGATIGSQNTATLNIVDNDAAILITGFPQGSQGSNLGKSTIIIAGQNFSPTDKISIISPTGTETLANQVYWVNKTEAWATFNLQGLATGQYDVKVMNGINTYTSNDTFTVNNDPLGNLNIELSYPASGFVKVTYTNIGQTDLRLFVTCYGSIGGHKSTKSLSGKGFN